MLFIAAKLHANFEDYLQNVLLRKKRSLRDEFSDGKRSGECWYPAPYMICPGWCPRDLAWQSTAVQSPAPCKSWEDSAEHGKCPVLLYWEHLVFAYKTCTHRKISQTITLICNLCEHVCICIVWQEDI